MLLEPLTVPGLTAILKGDAYTRIKPVHNPYRRSVFASLYSMSWALLGDAPTNPLRDDFPGVPANDLEGWYFIDFLERLSTLQLEMP